MAFNNEIQLKRLCKTLYEQQQIKLIWRSMNLISMSIPSFCIASEQTISTVCKAIPWQTRIITICMTCKYLPYKYTTENSLSSLSSVFALQLNVNNVKGKVNGNTVQCTFSATVPSSATRASTFSLGISTGSFNSCKLPYYRYTSSMLYMHFQQSTETHCHKRYHR